MKLSYHFVENWEKRVGGTPSVEQIQGIIDNSMRVQKGQYYRLSNGEPFNTLTIYWHPELNLVISYDSRRQVMVTVMSKANWTKTDKVKKSRKPAIMPGYVALSMHN